MNPLPGNSGAGNGHGHQHTDMTNSAPSAPEQRPSESADRSNSVGSSGGLSVVDDDDATRPGLGAAPRKVDVSHFPHYGLKRGMACTFCRRRKLRCSGDRPSCTNCVKHVKLCEYGPPVKEPKKQHSMGAGVLGAAGSSGARIPYDMGLGNAHAPLASVQPSSMLMHGSHIVSPLTELQPGMMYNAPAAQPSMSIPYEYYGGGVGSSNLSMDPSMVTAMSSMASTTPSLQPSPFGDFHQQSPFVTPPQPQQTTQPQPQQQQPTPQSHPVAQPIIGMAPYMSANGYSSFPDPNAAVQQQQWLPAQTPAVSALQTPQSGYGSAASVSGGASLSDYIPPPAATICRLSSGSSTPDDGPGRVGVTGNTTNPGTPSSATASRPLPSSMYNRSSSLHYTSDVNPVDGLTERLGEFLFSPHASAVKDEEKFKRRKPPGRGRAASPASIARLGREFDGLMDASRALLLDCFLAHATLFFEMSVPRFRYRMTFSDRRRPSLALLNAMYLWATRISNSPQMSTMEKHFFELSCKHLDTSTSTVDRLIDAVRAAMLLSAYSHSSGRHHEGWCLAGLAIRLVQSCGLHRIKSCVHKPEETTNPFLRNRFFLLPPAEDAVELGERIHAFWAVFAIDRCGSLATGYPVGIRDEDITTPFGRHLSDIASGSVSECDDITVRDLYRGAGAEKDTPYTKWVKCVAILERAAKMCFLEPADDSPYAQTWAQYSLTVHRDPMQAKPPEYLNQPKYRTPRDYRECLLAIEQLVNSIGDEGVFPVVRRMHAEQDGAPEPVIPTNILMLHHMVAAVHMVLHDINSIDVENPEALKAARKSVLLFRAMPQIPFTDVDAFVVLVWSMIAKVLIKEVHRLSRNGDMEGAHNAALEADTIIGEMDRIGQTMYLARTSAKAVDELKRAALAAGDKDAPQTVSIPQLETFMFPQAM